MEAKSLNELTEILQTLLNLHENLLDITKKKQEVLVTGDVKALLSLLSEESKVVKQIGETDVRRTSVVGEEPLSAYILHRGSQAEKQEWTQLQDGLLALVSDITTVNQTNAVLIKQSLSFTQHMMEQLLPTTQAAGYSRQHDTVQESSSPNRFFDAKV